MKKQLIAIFAMVMMVGAFAQNTATGPNKVYIEQIGSSNLITIEQVGGTNNVGGVSNQSNTPTVDNTGITTLTPTDPGTSNYATINGSSNQVGITQHGNNNSTQYNIKGSNNIYNSTVTGNNNKTNLKIGIATGENATNSLRNTVTETITGNDNMVITNLVANDVTSTNSITGNNNQVTQSLLSNNGSVSNTMSGNYNVLNIQQTDTAATGHSLITNTSGSYNSITTQQQGTNDTTVNIQTTGSNNTITVRSSNATIANPVSAIAR